MKTKSTFFCLLLAFCSTAFNAAKAQFNVQDSLALVDLYNSTDGPHWFDHTNWLTGPVYTWYGIRPVADQSHHPGVYLVRLKKNNLNGSIPLSIGNLLNCKELNLSYNNLSGNIPKKIGDLIQLSELNLSFNQLSGNIPNQIHKLGSIGRQRTWSLNLSHNRLSGPLPPKLFTGIGKRYYEIDLSFNQLEGDLSSFDLVNQRDIVLHLNNNKFYGSIPPSWASSYWYRELWLQNNYFTFDGMELVAGKPDNIYAPQANIPVHKTGDTLYVSAGGTLSNNTYKWFRVGQSGHTTITGDSVFVPSLEGDYYARIVNSICTELTLHTDTVHFGALPVNIVNLKAQQQGNLIEVEWTSLTGINVNNYEIQHSADTKSFTIVGTLPARDNGMAQLQYSFNDVKQVKGDNFYRIKVVNNDGKITYSNTVFVNMTSLAYPNPAKTVLNVQINGSGSFSLVNENGRVVLTKTITNSAAIDVSKFAAGVYYLKNNYTGEVQKVVVVK